MKKNLFRFLSILFLLLPVKVFAEGYISVSPESLTIEQGSSKTFTITAYNAIGDVSIKSDDSGVASSNIAEWGTGMVEENQTKTETVTIIGNNVGSTTITITIDDGATFDGDDLSGQTKTVSVNVIAKQTPVVKPSPQPSTPPNNPSNNNNVKTLTVEGYELVKVDDNNYSLNVANDITNINVNAIAEDSKAKVSGTGTIELQIGENNIEILVVSESGLENRINIKVTRNEGYYLENLDSILKNDKLQDVDIIINSDSKISKEDIIKIKDSKKKIRLNYYDQNRKLLYSWTISGKDIKESKELITSIDFNSKNEKEINKLSNNADGLYVDFKHSGDLPTGTKIKLYVGNKFDNESIVNVYHYNNNKKTLEIVKDNIKVTGGYIEFDIEHCSEYFVTMSKINVVFAFNLYTFLSIIVLIIIIIIVFCIFKSRSAKKNINNQLNNNKDNLSLNSSSINVNQINNDIPNNYMNNNINSGIANNNTPNNYMNNNINSGIANNNTPNNYMNNNINSGIVNNDIPNNYMNNNINSGIANNNTPNNYMNNNINSGIVNNELNNIKNINNNSQSTNENGFIDNNNINNNQY